MPWTSSKTELSRFAETAQNSRVIRGRVAGCSPTCWGRHAYGFVAAVAARTTATVSASLSARSPPASIVTTRPATGFSATLYKSRGLQNTPPDCIGIDAQKGGLDEPRIRQIGKNAFRIVDEAMKELRVFLGAFLNSLQCGLKRFPIHRQPPPRRSTIVKLLQKFPRDQRSRRPRDEVFGEQGFGGVCRWHFSEVRFAIGDDRLPPQNGHWVAALGMSVRRLARSAQ